MCSCGCGEKKNQVNEITVKANDMMPDDILVRQAQRGATESKAQIKTDSFAAMSNENNEVNSSLMQRFLNATKKTFTH
jgi:hypothetical protein